MNKIGVIIVLMWLVIAVLNSFPFNTRSLIIWMAFVTILLEKLARYG